TTVWFPSRRFTRTFRPFTSNSVTSLAVSETTRGLATAAGREAIGEGFAGRTSWPHSGAVTETKNRQTAANRKLNQFVLMRADTLFSLPGWLNLKSLYFLCVLCASVV